MGKVNAASDLRTQEFKTFIFEYAYEKGTTYSSLVRELLIKDTIEHPEIVEKVKSKLKLKP